MGRRLSLTGRPRRGEGLTPAKREREILPASVSYKTLLRIDPPHFVSHPALANSNVDAHGVCPILHHLLLCTPISVHVQKIISTVDVHACVQDQVNQPVWVTQGWVWCHCGQSSHPWTVCVMSGNCCVLHRVQLLCFCLCESISIMGNLRRACASMAVFTV